MHKAKVAYDTYGADFCARIKRSVMHKKLRSIQRQI